MVFLSLFVFAQTIYFVKLLHEISISIWTWLSKDGDFKVLTWLHSSMLSFASAGIMFLYADSLGIQ